MDPENEAGTALSHIYAPTQFGIGTNNIALKVLLLTSAAVSSKLIIMDT
jgi:hypothetical protein